MNGLRFLFFCCGAAAVESVAQRYASPSDKDPSLHRNASKQFVLLADQPQTAVSTVAVKDQSTHERRRSSVTVKALVDIEERVRLNNQHVSQKV